MHGELLAADIQKCLFALTLLEKAVVRGRVGREVSFEYQTVKVSRERERERDGAREGVVCIEPIDRPYWSLFA